MTNATSFGALSKLARLVGKAVLYAVVTLIPGLIALHAVLQTVPGLSGNDQNTPLPPLLYGPPNASSYRQDGSTLGAHSPVDLLDGDSKTFWVECKSESLVLPVNDGSSRIGPSHFQIKPGVSAGALRQEREKRGFPCLPADYSDASWAGEFVTFPLTTPTSIKALSVRNGDQLSIHEYYRNARVADMEVEAWTCQRKWYSFAWHWPWTCDYPNNGRANICWRQHLLDEQGFQSFTPPTTTSFGSSNLRACESDPSGARLPKNSVLTGVTQVRLTVMHGYPGEDQLPRSDPEQVNDGRSSDLALSEVALIPEKLPKN